MQSSNIPSKIPLPFAYAAGSGYKNTIPTASLIGIQDGKASLTDGFPPLNFTPVSSGGVPPFGSDMNGILNEVTAIQQWQEAGGFFPYDSAFSTIVGGYPKGAVLQSSSFNGFWVSTVENNTSNPDTGGAGWSSLAFEGLQTIAVVSNTATLTQLQSAYPIITVTGTLTANATLNIPAQVGEWIISNQTTGAFLLTVKTPSGTGVTVAQSSSQFIWGDGTNIYYSNASSVTSFNTRTGAITLNATDVTSALGYTPLQYGVGVDQTWQDVTSSRTYNTTYTNSTGKPIMVSAYIDGFNSDLPNIGITVGGLKINDLDSGTGVGSIGVYAVVPNGVTYAVNVTTGGVSLSLHWYELK